MRKSVIVDVRPEVVRGNPWAVRELDEILVLELEAVVHQAGFRGVLVGRALWGTAVMAGPSVTMDGEGEYGADGLLADLEATRATIQLAWGHHRLEAVKRVGLATVPVEVVWGLGDEEMASWALMENVRRRDLSAIEEARAILRLVEVFGWDQGRVAEALGYASNATVSNKLRLLRLPEAVQEKVVAGELAERKARSLVTLAGVSAKRAEKLAEEGEVSDWKVKSELRKATKSLTGGWEQCPWPMGWVPDEMMLLDGGEWVTCEECEEHVRVGDEELRCGKPRCWNKRRRRWDQGLVVQESEERGIPAVGEEEKGRKFGWQDEKLLAGRCKDRDGAVCEFLRLGHDRHSGVVEMCGGGEEALEKCKEWLEAQGKEEERGKEERAEEVRAVLKVGARALAGELGKLTPGLVDLLNESLYDGSGWKRLPEGWVGEMAVGWKVLMDVLKMNAYSVPEVAEVEGKVGEVLVQAGVSADEGNG